MRKKRMNSIIVPDDPPKGSSMILPIILLFIAPPFGTMAGIYMIYKRFRNEFKRKEYRDYRRYAAVIGDRSLINIRDLAKRLNKDHRQVANDLQNMINAGMIDPQAYIDWSTMTLYLDPDDEEREYDSPTVNIYVNQNDRGKTSAPIETVFVDPEPVQPSRPAPAISEMKAGTQQKPERKRVNLEKPVVADVDSFEEKLREIRKLNDDITNEHVSQRIDRIGMLTASIFRAVQEKPERTDEVRKFMNYYLPTTMKLLKSYSLMEKQSYQGENIQASRKKIEDVLDTLVHAFEQQQDRLFQADVLDVETDISVLETMMASDGLTQQSGGLHL